MCPIRLEFTKILRARYTVGALFGCTWRPGRGREAARDVQRATIFFRQPECPARSCRRDPLRTTRDKGRGIRSHLARRLNHLSESVHRPIGRMLSPTSETGDCNTLGPDV